MFPFDTMTLHHRQEASAVRQGVNSQLGSYRKITGKITGILVHSEDKAKDMTTKIVKPGTPLSVFCAQARAPN